MPIPIATNEHPAIRSRHDIRRHAMIVHARTEIPAYKEKHPMPGSIMSTSELTPGLRDSLTAHTHPIIASNIMAAQTYAAK
jgi:hypothetical protein